MTAVPLKWHGGKSYLASRIVALMPPHLHYVEPYAGGLAVLLEKDPEGTSEVVNDIDSVLMDFWRVLQDPILFTGFHRRIVCQPFSEESFNLSREVTASPAIDPISRAVAFFVQVRQSLAGRRDTFATLSRRRTRRGMNEQASAWLSSVEGLPAVHERLKRVVVLNREATEVIRTQDSVNTLFYCDPPYLHETREAPEVYHHEMTAQQHGNLLKTLSRCCGKVLLSGYRSELYDEYLNGWNRYDFDLPNNAASGADKRRMTECVWANF